MFTSFVGTRTFSIAANSRSAFHQVLHKASEGCIRLVLALALCLGALGTTQALAQSASAPLIIVTGAAAGSGVDLVARMWAQRLSTQLKRPVLVQNRPGAANAIAAQHVANAPKDGNTLLFAESAVWAILPHINPSIGYDPFRDLTPVAQAATGTLILVVNTALQLSTLQELLGYARQHPGKLNFASGGIGSTHHLSGELLKSMAGVDLLHVPYNGSAPAGQALLAGTDVQVGFVSYPVAQSGVSLGKLKMIGVNSLKRLPGLPEVPTLSESGLPGYDTASTLGFLAPAGTPAETVMALNRIVSSIAASDSALGAQLQKAGLGLADVTPPQEFTGSMRKEYEKFGPLVESSGAKLK